MAKIAMMVVAFAAMTAQAQTSVSTVFGLPLGEEVMLSECRYSGSMAMSPSSGMCLKEKNISNHGNDVQKTSVLAAFREWPSWARSMEVALINKKLEAITLETMGYSVASEIVKDLVAKYGKPMSLEPVVYKNQAGLETKVDIMSWKFDGLEVVYWPAWLSLRDGRIEINTVVGQAWRKKESEAMRALIRGKTPL